MPELIKTLEAVNEKEEESRKFQAAMQGINLGEEEQPNKGTSTFEEIRMRALGIEGIENDVIGLQGSMADAKGFGIGQGLAYDQE